MPDDMFFTKDERALRRGKRVERRTETCRPCLVSLIDDPSSEFEGVVLDVNPFGMLIRMMESLPIKSEIKIQLMRDDSFKVPFSSPLEGTVVRHDGAANGFTDHGVRLRVKDVPRAEPKAVARPSRGPMRPSTQSRMHTIDFRVGGSPNNRRR